MKIRKLHINNQVFEYSVHKMSVVARCPNGYKSVCSFTALFPDWDSFSIEKAIHKGGFPVKPSQIKQFIIESIIPRMNDGPAMEQCHRRQVAFSKNYPKKKEQKYVPTSYQHQSF